MKTVLATASACAILGASAPALAQDIGLSLRNGRLFTTVVEGEPPSQQFGTSENRVFFAEFDFNSTFPNIVAIDEPGYASNDVSLIGQSVQLFLRGPTRRWNGSAFQTESTFTLATGAPDLGVLFQTLPASGVAPGVTFNVLQDLHFDWTLNSATDTIGEGIYLAELDVRGAAGQGYLNSNPYFFVFSYKALESDVASATEYVNDVLVPAPGTGVMALAGLAALRRRSR